MFLSFGFRFLFVIRKCCSFLTFKSRSSIRSGFHFVFSLSLALVAPFLPSSLDLVFIVVVTLDSVCLSLFQFH